MQSKHHTLVPNNPKIGPHHINASVRKIDQTHGPINHGGAQSYQGVQAADPDTTNDCLKKDIKIHLDLPLTVPNLVTGEIFILGAGNPAPKK